MPGDLAVSTGNNDPRHSCSSRSTRVGRMATMPKDATIYHNPRCSTSRNVLEAIRATGVEPTIVEYLKTPPSRDGLRKLLDDAGLKPSEAVRKREALYTE